MTTDTKPRLAILISGRGSNMVALAKAAQHPDFPAETALVLSNQPDAAGLTVAAELGIPTLAISHRAYPDRAAFDAAVDTALRARKIDFIALAGFMRILTPEFIAGWENRIVNIHPSLLPKYPGLHTHARALAAGDAEAGCTVHLVTAELDCGPTLGQARVPILPGDTAETLAERILPEEHRLYPQALAAHIRRFCEYSLAGKQSSGAGGG